MVSARALVAAAAVAALCAVCASASVCNTGTKFMVAGASFDVTNLLRSGDTPDYIVTDGDIPCTPDVEQNFTYIFDICADVTGNNKPAVCDGMVGPALQFDPTGVGACHVVGTEGTFSLISENDPSVGIKLTYASGEPCHRQGAPNRKMTITMGCTNVAIPTPTVANEPEHCQYYVEMNSVYGCPLECPLGGENRDLCSAHGICAWDQTNGAAKCFCDDGYTGSDCNTKGSGAKSSGSNGAVIGLLVTVLLIAVVLGVVLFFVIRMLRAYRQDAHNYMAMHNQDLGTQDI